VTTITEYHWVGHDNTIDLVLKEDGSAVSTTSVTKAKISFDDQTIISTNQAGDAIRWDQAGYATGEIRISLNNETVNAGKHEATLTIYDAVNTDGVVWKHISDKLIIEVFNDPEVPYGARATRGALVVAGLEATVTNA